MRRGWVLGLAIAVVSMVAVQALAAEGDAKYVGNAKCKMCHMKQFKAWSETGHAKAFDKLKTADAKVTAAWAAKVKTEVKGAAAESEGCVSCHVVGHKKGGYPGADAAATANFAAVGCESCHGPGGKHVTAAKTEKKNTIVRPTAAASCTGCHTEATSPGFKFDAMKAKVHAVAAAAAK